MKKLLLILAVLVSLGVGRSFSGLIINTVNDGTLPIPADYGGVDIATNSFYIGLATVPSENNSQAYGYKKFYASTTTVNGIYAATRWTVYGVNFSTGQCSSNDFVSIQQSSGPASAAKEVTRLYNQVIISSAGANICSGYQFLRWPLRFYGNLFWGVDYPNPAGANGSNPYNRADLLYIREPE